MAVTDLIYYDILDLLPVNSLPEEDQEDYVYEFTKGFNLYLSNIMDSLLKERDQKVFESLINDEETTQEEITEFFHKRGLDSEVLYEEAAVKFKKSYLTNIYNAIVQKQSVTGDSKLKDAWEKIISYAKDDQWDMVSGEVANLNTAYEEIQNKFIGETNATVSPQADALQ